MIAVLVAALLACVAPTLVHAQDGPEPGPQPYNHWVQVHENAPFAPRASAVSAYFPPTDALPNGRWLLMSGMTNDPNEPVSRTLSDVWTSDDVGVTWNEQNWAPLLRCEMAADVVTVPSASGDGSVSHVLVVTGGLDFVSRASYQDVHISTDYGASFIPQVIEAPWPARHGHALVTVDRTAAAPGLLLLGGYSFDDEHAHYLNDVWISHNLGVNWTALPPASWAPRGDAAVHATRDGIVFVAGGVGRVDAWEGLLNDVWMSSASLTSWTQMTAAARWAPRWGHALKHYNDSLILIGGDTAEEEDTSRPTKNSEIWLSQDNGASWHWVAVAQFSGRSDFMTEVINGQLFVVGGTDATETSFAHVNNEIWTTGLVPDPEPPTPSGGSHHDGKEIGTGGIIAIVVAAVAVIALAAYFIFRRKAAQNAAPAGGYHLQV